MANRRKTIEVARLVDMANTFFEHANTTPEARSAMQSFVARILHETNNYHGFNYIEWLNGGCDRWNADGRPTDGAPYLGDQTRIRFYHGAAEAVFDHVRAYPKALPLV